MSFASPRDLEKLLGETQKFKTNYLEGNKINFDKLNDDNISKKIAISILNSPNSYGSINH